MCINENASLYVLRERKCRVYLPFYEGSSRSSWVLPHGKGREMLSELPPSICWEDETMLGSFVLYSSTTPGSPKVFCPGPEWHLDRASHIFSLCKYAHYTYFHTHTLIHTHTHAQTQTYCRHTHKLFHALISIHTHTYSAFSRLYCHGLLLRPDTLKQIRACIVYWGRKLQWPWAGTVHVHTRS